MPGCEDAKLRNFGMTVGIRDTRKIDALYNLTGNDVREQAGSTMPSAFSRNSSTATAYLILPTTGRYWHVPYRALVPKAWAIYWWRAAASAATTFRMPRRAT
jgi:hypothetical protein